MRAMRKDFNVLGYTRRGNPQGCSVELRVLWHATLGAATSGALAPRTPPLPSMFSPMPRLHGLLHPATSGVFGYASTPGV